MCETIIIDYLDKTGRIQSIEVDGHNYHAAEDFALVNLVLKLTREGYDIVELINAEFLGE